MVSLLVTLVIRDMLNNFHLQYTAAILESREWRSPGRPIWDLEAAVVTAIYYMYLHIMHPESKTFKSFVKNNTHLMLLPRYAMYTEEGS